MYYQVRTTSHKDENTSRKGLVFSAFIMFRKFKTAWDESGIWVYGDPKTNVKRPQGDFTCRQANFTAVRS